MSGASATVVGAGVIGASVARELALRGWDVTLAEQYAPGTVRSASGGDTRLLRAAHGEPEWYTASAVRARTLWLELQESTGTRIWEGVGLAWLARRADGFEAASAPVLERLGIPYEWLSPDDARDLFPSLAVDDLHAVLYEPQAGVLHARRATQLLVEDGERAGVRLTAERLTPSDDPPGDVVVWACGAWLPQLFPEHVAVEVERRDVFFLGGDHAWRGTPGFVRLRRRVLRARRRRRSRREDRAGLAERRRRPGPARPRPLRALGDDRPRLRGAALPRSRQPRPSSARVCASTTCRQTRTSSPTGTRRTTAGGCSAAARGTASSTARRFAEYVADCIEGTPRARALPRARRAHRPSRACAPASARR